MKINTDNFSIGTDIVSHKKILFFFNKKKYLRILTKNELNELNLRKGYERINYLSGRWAAKEAIYKALYSYYNTNLINIEILNDKNGKPYCNNFKNAKISISHTKKYSIAFCIFVKE